MPTFEGLPGAVAVSHLRVYDWPAEDGLRGGTPHLHLTCSEGYVVVGGSGSVQTLTTSGFRQTPLTPGALVWFTPGTIHRLVNEDGLRIVVLMENSGLPEAGDAVLTLPPRHLADPVTYRAAVALPADGCEAEQERAARARRDLAVEGFLALRRATEAGDPGPLAAFHRAAAALVRPRAGDWRERWRNGAAAASEVTGGQLDALARGDGGYLADARVHAEQPSAHGRFGMCGRLDVYRG
ncbi:MULTISPECIES: cupin domain-containing protein [unclassified Streptomyces]|uniref:cupin domain-containing protein n=1 Tax=unclassified Streptomyces TaxID=2593676 RepID=UPI00224FE14E|nr:MULTISPECIES: cupin [unclassified Streptomyces]WSP53709.1 cupin [Streptomyces sp. NBC_01241]WSU25623.1 cupin [Streptomyces sp. NBC_01108]MCX4785108.1 cupin [Streptomyces sp. NBC_01221]MCX4798950.1 cupin [Streptomyces sp. NBC_01242]WSJ40147.1 cupin [Streptomyces sp. NBC_01321]